MVIAGAQVGDVGLPAAVRAVVGRAAWRPVWRNEVGGLTFELSTPYGRRFLKWVPASSGIDLGQEIDRLRWAGNFCPVPAVIDHGGDEQGSWLLTHGLAGDNAVSARWLADPATAVTAIGAGLRALHDALAVKTCPFTWSAADRVTDARRRADAGRLRPAGWHDIHAPLGVSRALARAADAPPVDRLVVCHGDACAPNTLITPAGTCAGHVDLGSLGTADRWADLAVATWSTQWNYGPGWERPLLDAYGIDDDPERTAYYRLLWDLGP